MLNIQTLLAQIDTERAISRLDRQYFIENKGQWPDEVFYLTRMGGLDVWTTRKGGLYDFYKLEEVKSNKQEKRDLPFDKFSHREYIRIGHRVLFELEGSNIDLNVEGKQRQEGYYNYFIGNDPSKYATNVGLYKEAVVKGVYSGIDMRYYFDEGMLRYDYVVHSGADPSEISFILRGSDKNYLDGVGNFVFTTRFGEVKMASLHCYQGQDRKPVEGKFVRRGDDAWGIEVCFYDATQPLIIDPLVYSTYIRGSGDDWGFSITIDWSGNSYITGETKSTDYPITPGAY